MPTSSISAFLSGALVLAGVSLASATTVYYQPTPFPLKTFDGSSMPQSIEALRIWDGWLGSHYYTSFVRTDDKLQLGGWGDEYRTYIKFDLTGLPKNVTRAVLWLQGSQSDTSKLTPFKFCKVGGSWNTSLYSGTQPSMLQCAGWFTPPSSGNWWGIDFTPWYLEWQRGQVLNNGIMMAPQYTNNKFDLFRSSRFSGDGSRPILQFEFTPPAGMPNFKIPLPRGYSWLVTNEIGGYECKGTPPFPSPTHAGDNYFSLDFSPTNKKDGGGASLGGDIPVLAAAAGKVIAVGGSTSDSRGFYITLDHGNGYQTRYLHFKQHAARKNGTRLAVNNSVAQGDQIGIMGNTGTSTATHLHLNFWYNGKGGTNQENLANVVMDSWLLKSFQTECSKTADGKPVNNIRYYRSTNTPTGK